LQVARNRVGGLGEYSERVVDRSLNVVGESRIELSRDDGVRKVSRQGESANEVRERMRKEDGSSVGGQCVSPRVHLMASIRHLDLREVGADRARRGIYEIVSDGQIRGPQWVRWRDCKLLSRD